MRDFWQALRFFTSQGMINGLLLGALAGTLTYPIAGTIVGLFYGGGIGFVLGIVLAVAISIYNQRITTPDLDWEQYRSNLTFYAGLGAAILTALPLMVIYAPVAGLAAAYTAHQYAEKFAGRVVKRKNDERLIRRYDIKRHTIGAFIGLMVRKARPLVAIIWGLGFIALTGSAIATAVPFLLWLGTMLAFTLLLPVGAAICMGLLGLTVGSVLHMLNRIYFREDMEKDQYKRQVMIIAAGLMILTSPVVTLVIGAPIAAVVAALAARDYAEWYYDDSEKPKRQLAPEDASARLRQAPQDEFWNDENIEAKKQIR